MTTGEYDEYEVIDPDTKRRLGRFIDLKSARKMAQWWANRNYRSIEIWGVFVTKTREQVETVTRTETEQRHQGEDYGPRKKIVIDKGRD